MKPISEIIHDPVQRKIYTGWAIKRLALIFYDILAVNFAYFFALLVRFWINNHFRPIANEYVPAFGQFAPWYTVCCIIVFAAMQLYTSRWAHAGIHDLNRIFFANAITCVIQVAGTLLFIKRMPLTYYGIGAVMQFFLITVSRFSLVIWRVERKRLSRKGATELPTMIVGTGETSQILRRQLEDDASNAAKPVCLFSWNDPQAYGKLNGLPVLTEVNRLPENLKKYGVKCAILADPLLSLENRKQLRSVCEDNGVEVQDFSGYLALDSAHMSPRKVLPYINGKVRLILDGKPVDFATSEEALTSLQGRETLQGIWSEKDYTVLKAVQSSTRMNNTDEDWVKKTEQQTGLEISFF